MFSTTEITSGEIHSDNVIHQRLLYAYYVAKDIVKGDVLELGCGFGRGIEMIGQNATSYTAVDKNEDLITKLGNKYSDYTFISGNMPPLPIEGDEKYDTIITCQVIEHIEDDHLFLKEIKRLLKPNGKAIITTPNKSMSLTRNPWHVREYTPSEMKNILEKYFSKVEVKGVSGNEKITNYYEKNKVSVKKITRFDIFNLQYLLPRSVLQVPYDMLNRMNRKKLLEQNSGLVSDVSLSDYTILEDPAKGLDFFCIVEK